MLSARLCGQHVLLADDNGTLRAVLAAKGSSALVEKNGKLEEIQARRFALRDVPEYLPVFISIRDVDVRVTYEQMGGAGSFNNNFHLSAKVESAYALRDVFIVLFIESQSGRKAMFLNEIGTLEPNRSTPLVLFVPMDEPLGSGNYSLHLFSGGAEVLQSTIPYLAREDALNKMVDRRVKNVDASAPKYFTGPAPEYPAALEKAGVKGQAVVSIRIAANGEVHDPVVKSATDPAFGQAALTAITSWRFLPRVKDGRPVESKVDVPFHFSPPKAS
jgi:TonB family protein